MLARKISLAKWAGSGPGAEISADAVTGDLRTSGNTLSFWSVETPTREELESVVLALASAWQRIDKMDLTWIDPEVLRSQGITLESTEGDTRVESLKSRHVDVAKLDLVRLGRVAETVSGAISRECCRRWTDKEVLQILVNAVASSVLDPALLAENVQKAVSKRLRRDKAD